MPLLALCLCVAPVPRETVRDCGPVTVYKPGGVPLWYVYCNPNQGVPPGGERPGFVCRTKPRVVVDGTEADSVFDVNLLSGHAELDVLLSGQVVEIRLRTRGARK